MKNKSLALFMCATMACVTVPVNLAGNTAINVKTVKAAEVTAGDYTYDTNGVDSITITKYTGNESVLVIPEKIDGYTVTKIEKKVFYNNKNLQSVEIPDEVTEIGDNAFYKCEKLEKVTLPAKLKKLGSNTFKNCTSLSSITIPKSLEEVNTPFEGCDHLYTAVIENGATKVCEDLFKESGVQNVTIPETVEKIGGGAFWNCDNLQSIEIPDRVTEIEKYAFYSCDNLGKVKLPSNLYEMGFNAFNKCTSLSSITIPKTLEKVSTPFDGCEHLYTAVIENGAKKVCEDLFKESGVQNVTIPETVEKIGGGAFWNCDNLKSIEIPDNVTEIEKHAFYSCEKLEKIELPVNLKKIEYGSFNNCSKLETVYFYGNAPEFENSTVFSNVTATVYTPEGDTTWTADKKKNYDGTLTWKTFVSTKQPTVSEKPVVTETPKVTQTPIVTETPQVTQTPGITKTPEKTQEPVVTKTPAPTTSSEAKGVLEVKTDKVVIKSVKAIGKKKVKVSWKKADNETIWTNPAENKVIIDTSGISGYKLQYATKKNFKSAKTKKISANKTSITLTNLKKGKTYYVRVRAYKNVDGKTKYGAWSTVKKCKVK